MQVNALIEKHIDQFNITVLSNIKLNRGDRKWNKLAFL